MPYTELLRMTVFLTAGEATTLGVISVLSASRDQDATLLIFTAAWWAIAVILGLRMGDPERTADSMREVLAKARSASPDSPGSMSHPGRIVVGRLWPIAATAVLAGGLGVIWAPVAAVGSGYALMVALAWRSRERAVLAIEERDGVRFLVEPGSPAKPVKLVRTPGLTRF